MSLFATGTANDQIPNTGRLGGAAFLNISDLHLMFAPVLTLDQIRNEPVTLAKYIIVDDASVIGLYRYDSSDTTTADNGSTVLVTTDGRRYKPASARSGTTASRPATTGMAVGYNYYDTTLGKPVWWNGSAWKDAAGTTV